MVFCQRMLVYYNVYWCSVCSVCPMLPSICLWTPFRPLRHGLAQVVWATLELGGNLRISGARCWVAGELSRLVTKEYQSFCWSQATCLKIYICFIIIFDLYLYNINFDTLHAWVIVSKTSVIIPNAELGWRPWTWQNLEITMGIHYESPIDMSDFGCTMGRRARRGGKRCQSLRTWWREAAEAKRNGMMVKWLWPVVIT